MSRVFWIAVGAVGGIVAYRKGTEAAARARELGALGTAQVVTRATGRAAIGAAHGLGRLRDYQARRQGRLIIGTAQDVTPAESPTGAPIPGDWVPAPRARGEAGARAGATRPRAASLPVPASARTRSRTAPRHASGTPAGTAAGTPAGAPPGPAADTTTLDQRADPPGPPDAAGPPPGPPAAAPTPDDSETTPGGSR